jgi:hypothetical protein
MESAATFGYLASNIGRDQQGWLAVGFAVGFDHRRGLEPIDRFEFGVEAVFTAVPGELDHRIGRKILPRCWRVDLSVEPR